VGLPEKLYPSHLGKVPEDHPGKDGMVTAPKDTVRESKKG